MINEKNDFLFELVNFVAMEKKFYAAPEKEKEAIKAEYENGIKKEIDAKGELYKHYFNKYVEAHHLGNHLIDFNVTIFDNDIPKMVEEMKSLGIQFFTVSARNGDANMVLLFIKNGCQLNGVREVYTSTRNFATRENEKAAAFEFEII